MAISPLEFCLWEALVLRRMTCIYYARRAGNASGELPIFVENLRLGEFVVTLVLTQDNAFGRPWGIK